MDAVHRIRLNVSSGFNNLLNIETSYCSFQLSFGVVFFSHQLQKHFLHIHKRLIRIDSIVFFLVFPS